MGEAGAVIGEALATATTVRVGEDRVTPTFLTLAAQFSTLMELTKAMETRPSLSSVTRPANPLRRACLLDRSA